MRRALPTTSAVLVSLLLLGGSAAALAGPDFDRPGRWFDDHVYHHHADLTTELQQLRSDHPRFVDLTSIGTSVQGRELWTVRVTDPSVPAAGKVQVYIDGEHHGNEQLSGELAVLLLHHLLEDRSDPRVQQVLGGYIVWVTPMLNPDGNARDRRTNANGVDINRNYPFSFSPGGNHGEAPASEPEVQANVAFMGSLDLDLYVTMHTGIVRLIHPWSYCHQRPPDFPMFDNLTGLSESHGITYGQASHVLYEAAGTAKDFGYGALGVPSFTYEVDEEQSRQITAREDIATRLADELDLLMDLVLATPAMGAALEVADTTYREEATGFDVELTLENSGLSAANNTTVTVEAWRGADMVEAATVTVDVPAGDSTGASVQLELDGGEYVLRTILEYPARLQENSTLERVVLDTHRVTVSASVLAGAGGWGVGLLLVLVGLGVALLLWARGRGRWRPGMLYGRLLTRLRPQAGT